MKNFPSPIIGFRGFLPSTLPEKFNVGKRSLNERIEKNIDLWPKGRILIYTSLKDNRVQSKSSAVSGLANFLPHIRNELVQDSQDGL